MSEVNKTIEQEIIKPLIVRAKELSMNDSSLSMSVKDCFFELGYSYGFDGMIWKSQDIYQNIAEDEKKLASFLAGYREGSANKERDIERRISRDKFWNCFGKGVKWIGFGAGAVTTVFVIVKVCKAISK